MPSIRGTGYNYGPRWLQEYYWIHLLRIVLTRTSQDSVYLYIIQATEESRQQQREYEETKKQIEEDADREILDIKNKYERRLRDEKEANMRLKGETGIMRKKVRIGFSHSKRNEV